MTEQQLTEYAELIGLVFAAVACVRFVWWLLWKPLDEPTVSEIETGRFNDPIPKYLPPVYKPFNSTVNDNGGGHFEISGYVAPAEPVKVPDPSGDMIQIPDEPVRFVSFIQDGMRISGQLEANGKDFTITTKPKPAPTAVEKERMTFPRFIGLEAFIEQTAYTPVEKAQADLDAFDTEHENCAWTQDLESEWGEKVAILRGAERTAVEKAEADLLAFDQRHSPETRKEYQPWLLRLWKSERIEKVQALMDAKHAEAKAQTSAEEDQ